MTDANTKKRKTSKGSNPRITAVVNPVSHQVLFSLAECRGESLSIVCGSIINDWVRQNGMTELTAWQAIASQVTEMWTP